MSEGVVFFFFFFDDERFIEQIVKPRLNIDNVNTHRYSSQPDPSVNQVIGGFQGMYRELYLLRDFDKGKQNCNSSQDRKEFVKKKFPNIRDDQIIIVKDAIEGWYLAGLDSEQASNLDVDYHSDTENIGKEEFQSELASSKFTSKKNFQMEVIDKFSISVARDKNSSFNRFLERIDNIL